MKRYLLSLLLLLAGAVLFQGFQCASREMTTAILAKKNNDLPKAKEYLEKELANNPANDEARVLLAEVKFGLRDYVGLAHTLNEAEDKIKDTVLMQKILFHKNTFWVTCYQHAQRYNEVYGKTKNSIYIDSAIFLTDLGLMVRPRMLDFYYLKAFMLELKGDTSSAIQAYEKYIEMAEPELEFCRNYNIFIDMPQSEIRRKFGKPLHVTTVVTAGGDSIYSEKYRISGKEVWFYTMNENKTNTVLKGFLVDPPARWLEPEKEQWNQFNINPLSALAQIYYERKQFDKTLHYMKIITQIDPGNERASSSLISLYQILNQNEEALASAKELTEKDPKNKYYWVQYADILTNQKDYDEALDKYEKALAIDARYCPALRNIASAYKNKASIIQRAQQDRGDKDKTYKPNPEEYIQYLKKSAEYFEKCLSCDTYKEDFMVYGELSNIYEVIDDNVKLAETVKKLEILEPSITIDNLELFYLKMINVYSNLQDSKKLAVYKKKLEDFKK